MGAATKAKQRVAGVVDGFVDHWLLIANALLGVYLSNDVLELRAMRKGRPA